MRITAALLERAGQPFVLTDVDLEAPRPDEVLVRVVSAGICGTDLDFASHWPTPIVLGHEGAGVVEQVGDRVSTVRPGDHVALTFASCGRCSLCLTGTPSYCRSFDALNFTGRRSDSSSALSRHGEPVDGHFIGQSTFASHAVVPERAVIPIPASIDLAHVGPFGCGFQTGAGAVFNVLQPRPGSSIAVFGAGAVGASAIIAAQLSGCSPIVGVDISNQKLRSAVDFGATHVINSEREDVAAELAAIVDGGLQFVIDTTGREDVLRGAVKALGPLGRAGVIGIGPSESMSFEWHSFLNGRSVTGIVSGGSVPQVFVPRLLALHAEGQFPVDRMCTYFPFEDINAAVDAVRAGAAAKAILTF